MARLDLKFLYEKYVLGRHNRSYEPKVKKKLSSLHGHLFVDIGANQGLYVKLLSNSFDAIYAFEPNPEHTAKLARLNGNISIYDYALSDREGKTMLYLDPAHGNGGSAETILPFFDYKPGSGAKAWPDKVYIGERGIEVKTARYDDFVKEIADLVKIDVEGAEFLVLEGMSRSLERRMVKRFLIELHNRNDKARLEQLMAKFHYTFKWIDPDHLYAENLERSVMEN